MEHQGRVHALEHPCLGQPHLPGAAHLLTGCADDGDSAGMRGQRPYDGQRGRDGSGGDEVVPAAVPDPGQGVVLGEQGDIRPRSHAFVYGDERGVHPPDLVRHRESGFREPSRQDLVGVVLGELQLRSGVDVEAHGLHPGPQRAEFDGQRVQRGQLGAGHGASVGTASRAAGTAVRRVRPPSHHRAWITAAQVIEAAARPGAPGCR